MIKLISKRVRRYIGVVLCLLPTGMVSAERADMSARGRVENRSFITRCAEVDNIDMPLYARNMSAFRVTAIHPSYFPAPINIRAADFTDCTFGDRRLWVIGRQDGSSAEFQQVGSVDRHVFFAADRPPAGKDMQSSAFPQAIGAGVVTNQFIHFTADEDADANVELKIGADLHVYMSALEGNADAKQLTLRCLTWDGTDWQHRGDRTFTPDQMDRVWHIPDMSWIEGTDANIIHLRVVTAEEGGATSPNTRGLYDYIELRRRATRGETKLPPLVRNDFIEVIPVHIDFWWRYPESMTVEVVGGAKATNVHYLRIQKSAPGSDPPDVDELFVLYEDGNARLVPLPPVGVDISYGASIILGPSADTKRPIAPIKKIVVQPRDLALDVYYKDGTMLHLELWADRTQTVMDVTRRLVDTEPDVPFARLRSMWVYDGNADIDRLLSTEGMFPLMHHRWEALDSSWWHFVKMVPTYHNTYSPDFYVEILDPSPAYLTLEAENAREGRGWQPQANSAASAGQVLRVSPQGGEAIYRFELARSRPATQMWGFYADPDGDNANSDEYYRLHAYVDGEFAASTYMARTGGRDDFEVAPGLALGDLAPGQHTLKLVVEPATQGVQLDRIELVSQPMRQRRKEPVLSVEAEALSAGEGYRQVSHDRASGQRTIHMAAAGGTAIFRVHAPVSIEEAYLTLHYLDDAGPNDIQIFIDGEAAGKFPTLSTEGRKDFITSPELFIGPLRVGEHEIRVITSPGAWGVEIDKFVIFSR
jgi:hypothetical protein